jgi:hypothetical protein
MTRYRHTQFGWAVVVSLLIPIAVLIVVAATVRTFVPLLSFIPLLLILPLFGWLTVDVTDDSVGLSFGIGLIAKRVRIEDVESIAPVTNAWLSGWGIRLIPGGWLYNVSGRQAVELALRNGRKMRIGTDDQDGLVAALREARTTVLPSMPLETVPMLGYTRAGPMFVLGLCLAAPMLIVFTISAKSIEVATSPTEVAVRGAGYAARVPTDEVLAVHLDEQLPAISRRTNGFSFRGRLRGHFTLSDGRAAQLFVTPTHPPFITLETQSEPVIFNYDDPERTRRLFAQLSARF